MSWPKAGRWRRYSGSKLWLKMLERINLKDALIYTVSGLLLAACACNNHTASQPESQPTPETTAGLDTFDMLRPSYWVYGMSQPKDRQRQVAAAWYKFRYRIIAGCIVTDSLERAANEHNRITDSILTARIGKDWRDKFEHTVDSLYASDSSAIEIARADPFIHHFDKAAEKYDAGYDYYPNLRYTCHPTPEDHIKVVVTEGYGVIHGQVEWVSYLRAKVDMKKKKVIAIDKTSYVPE